MANIIQQLEDLKEWGQNPERYARRLEFRHRSGAPYMEVLSEEFDEFTPREEEYYKEPPFSTRKEYRKGQLVQPGQPGVRQGYATSKKKTDKFKYKMSNEYGSWYSDTPSGPKVEPLTTATEKAHYKRVFGKPYNIDDTDHLELKEIADEINEEVIIKRASGGLAYALGE